MQIWRLQWSHTLSNSSPSPTNLKTGLFHRPWWFIPFWVTFTSPSADDCNGHLKPKCSSHQNEVNALWCYTWKSKLNRSACWKPLGCREKSTNCLTVHSTLCSCTHSFIARCYRIRYNNFQTKLFLEGH